MRGDPSKYREGCIEAVWNEGWCCRDTKSISSRFIHGKLFCFVIILLFIFISSPLYGNGCRIVTKLAAKAGRRVAQTRASVRKSEKKREKPHSGCAGALQTWICDFNETSCSHRSSVCMRVYILPFISLAGDYIALFFSFHSNYNSRFKMMRRVVIT